jgi:hypothetical protein
LSFRQTITIARKVTTLQRCYPAIPTSASNTISPVRFDATVRVRQVTSDMIAVKIARDIPMATVEYRISFIGILRQRIALITLKTCP